MTHTNTATPGSTEMPTILAASRGPAGSLTSHSGTSEFNRYVPWCFHSEGEAGGLKAPHPAGACPRRRFTFDVPTAEERSEAAVRLRAKTCMMQGGAGVEGLGQCERSEACRRGRATKPVRRTAQRPASASQAASQPAPRMEPPAPSPHPFGPCRKNCQGSAVNQPPT